MTRARLALASVAFLCGVLAWTYSLDRMIRIHRMWMWPEIAATIEGPMIQELPQRVGSKRFSHYAVAPSYLYIVDGNTLHGFSRDPLAAFMKRSDAESFVSREVKSHLRVHVNPSDAADSIPHLSLVWLLKRSFESYTLGLIFVGMGALTLRKRTIGLIMGGVVLLHVLSFLLRVVIQRIAPEAFNL